MAHGADKADEDGNIKVQHEVKEENFEKFKKHVDAMEASGKRKEMGAKNPPY
jgi:acylphosphatase